MFVALFLILGGSISSITESAAFTIKNYSSTSFRQGNILQTNNNFQYTLGKDHRRVVNRLSNPFSTHYSKTILNLSTGNNHRDNGLFRQKSKSSSERKMSSTMYDVSSTMVSEGCNLCTVILKRPFSFF